MYGINTISPSHTAHYLYDLTDWYTYYMNKIHNNDYTDGDTYNDETISVVLFEKVFGDISMTLNFAMVKIKNPEKTLTTYINISFIPTTEHLTNYVNLNEMKPYNINEIISKYGKFNQSSWVKQITNLNNAVTCWSFGLGSMGWVNPSKILSSISNYDTYETILYTKDVREVYAYMVMCRKCYEIYKIKYTPNQSMQYKLDITTEDLRNILGLFGGLLISIKPNPMEVYINILSSSKDSNHVSTRIDDIYKISSDYMRRYEVNINKSIYKGYPPTDMTEPMVQYYMKACDIMKDYPTNPQEVIDDYKKKYSRRYQKRQQKGKP